MRLKLNSEGEADTDIIDWFNGAKPVTLWLSERNKKQDIDDHDFMVLDKYEGAKYKLDLFLKACKSYFDATGEDDLKALRHEPYVIVNYRPIELEMKPYYWFIFKEDNNGTTYKFFHDE